MQADSLTPMNSCLERLNNSMAIDLPAPWGWLARRKRSGCSLTTLASRQVVSPKGSRIGEIFRASSQRLSSVLQA